MNSLKIIVALLLFMVVCATPYVRAADQGSDGRTGHMHSDTDIHQACRDLRDKLRGKEQSQIPLRDLDIHQDLNCCCELLEELEKKEPCSRQDQDQQADILEKLLQESTKSGTPPPVPDQ